MLKNFVSVSSIGNYEFQVAAQYGLSDVCRIAVFGRPICNMLSQTLTFFLKTASNDKPYFPT